MDKLLFSDRKKLVDEYYDWLSDHLQFEDSLINFLAWCNIVEILDIEKAKGLLKK